MPKAKISAITFGLLTAITLTACSRYSPPVPGQSDITEAALLAVSCSGCHQTDNSSIPPFDGTDTAALRDILMKYKTHADGQTVMHRLMRGYSDDDISVIAAYLGEPNE